MMKQPQTVSYNLTMGSRRLINMDFGFDGDLSKQSHRLED